MFDILHIHIQANIEQPIDRLVGTSHPLKLCSSRYMFLAGVASLPRLALKILAFGLKLPRSRICFPRLDYHEHFLSGAIPVVQGLRVATLLNNIPALRVIHSIATVDANKYTAACTERDFTRPLNKSTTHL